MYLKSLIFKNLYTFMKIKEMHYHVLQQNYSFNLQNAFVAKFSALIMGFPMSIFRYFNYEVSAHAYKVTR